MTSSKVPPSSRTFRAPVLTRRYSSLVATRRSSASNRANPSCKLAMAPRSRSSLRRSAASACLRSAISSVSSRVRTSTRRSKSSWAWRSSSSTRSRWTITVATSRAMALKARPSSWNSEGTNPVFRATRASRLPPSILRAALTTASTGRTNRPDRNQLKAAAMKRPRIMSIDATRFASPACFSSSGIGCGTIIPHPVRGTVVKPVIMSLFMAGE